MMEDWKEVKLGEITEMIKRGVAPKYVEDDGYIVINQKCIRNGVLSFESSRLTSKAKRVSEEKFIKIGDVLINSTGTGTLGRTAPVRKLLNKTTVDTHVTIFRGKDSVHKLFLGYLLKYHEPLITLLGKGATNQIELGASDLKVSKVKIPKSKETQRKIASILSGYDDLIENNLKRIKLLEEQAQQTYEEWFVRFKFPGYENVGIDEESGLLVGWEKVKLGDVLEISSSKRIFLSDYVSEGIPFYRGKEIILKSKNEALNDRLFISEEKFKKVKTKYDVPKEGDILVTAVGTLGYPYLVTKSDGDFYFKDGNLIWLKGNESISSVYLISSFKNEHFQTMLNNIAIGSSQKALTIKSLKAIKHIIPSLTIQKKYNELVISIYNSIENLQNQNQHLKEARDILLPRLMSGMIDVDGLEVGDSLAMVAENNEKYN